LWPAASGATTLEAAVGRLAAAAIIVEMLAAAAVVGVGRFTATAIGVPE
jgi:hypothetical protein